MPALYTNMGHGYCLDMASHAITISKHSPHVRTDLRSLAFVNLHGHEKLRMGLWCIEYDWN